MSEAKWCYSIDEVSFKGCHETEEDAHEGAQEELDWDLENGESSYYEIAKIKHPENILKEARFGDYVIELLEEILSESTGSENETINLSAEKIRELEDLIINHISVAGKFLAYGVSQIEQHKYTKGA